MTAFQGLPPGLFSFFAELERDNSREFWQANKDRWERDVHLPMQTLIDALAAEFGPLRLFRPNRDTRFSTDKSPYKLRTAATTISKSRAVGGVGYYLEASAMGMIAGYGAMMMDADQLRRFREAIDNDVSGSAFDRLCELQASRSLDLVRLSGTPQDRSARLQRGSSAYRILALEGCGDCRGMGTRRLDAHSRGARCSTRCLARSGTAQELA
ncbi:MAG: DUF2461 domain-containing protein [Thermomicrobiales bacterium]|nr:DUF2461 domain-containing protein [Thermomicrobiales bacterium]